MWESGMKRAAEVETGHLPIYFLPSCRKYQPAASGESKQEGQKDQASRLPNQVVWYTEAFRAASSRLPTLAEAC
jgi:hypothetical protein